MDSDGTSTAFVDLSNDNILVELAQDMPNESQDSLLEECTSMLPPYGTENFSKKSLKCPECPRYSTDDQEKMTRHIRKVHRGENPYQCTMCEYSTYNSCLFQEHVNIHKRIKPFQCSHCPHRSVSKKNLKRHENIHRPDNPLKCQKCDFIAQHQKSYICHMKKKHSDEKIIGQNCSYCNKTFPDDKMVLHTARVRTCNMIKSNNKRCNFTTCAFQIMSSHKQKEHGQPKKVTKPRSKNKMLKTFKCRLCEWSSNRPTRILLHLVHHPNQTVEKGVVDLSILYKHNIVTQK